MLTATEPPAPVVPVIPDRPELQVRLTGASQARVGQPSLFTIEVANTGNIPLTGLRVNYRYPDSLTPSRVDKKRPATDHLPGNLIWEINQLEVGQRHTWDVECIAQRGGVDAIARVDATSQQNASDSVELKTQIAAVAAPPAGVDPGPGGGAVPDIGDGPQNGNVKGELTLSIADQGDPIRVGQRVTYLLVLKNDRNATDRNVRLTVAFPTGLDFKTLRSPLQGTVRASDREIELPSIAEMRAGESITIRVEAEATQVGQFMVLRHGKEHAIAQRCERRRADNRQRTIATPLHITARDKQSHCQSGETGRRAGSSLNRKSVASFPIRFSLVDHPVR